MLWSILIPTLRERRADREALLDHLYDQAWPHHEVEVIVLEDDRRVPFHRKLNNLVRIAAGQYLSFVDDDDWIAPDYIDSILAALHAHPEVDAVCFDTVWSLDGGPTVPVRFGPDLVVGGNPTDGFTRPIQHLQVIRADIARQFDYGPPDHGTDTLWSKAVRDAGVIRYVTEPIRRYPDQPMYHHRATSDPRDGLWTS